MATLHEAVVKGLAGDRGLYMPESIKQLPQSFFDNIETMSFQDIAFTVAQAFFGEDIPDADLRRIVDDTLSFDCPVAPVTDNIYSLELFHGPTLAFKDVGARFMARLLQYFIRQEGREQVNVLVATSGDTGSAVANGFLGVDGIHVYVLYPKGKVSKIQECQFTTLGQNITAVEVAPVYHDGKTWFTANKDGKTLYAIYTVEEGEQLPTTITWKGNLPKGKMTLLQNGKKVSYKTHGDEVTVSIPGGLRTESLAFRFQLQ